MDIKQDVHIWLQGGQKEDSLRGENLARRFGLSAGLSISPRARFNLAFNDGRLELYSQADTELLGPLSVDFLSASSLHRCRTDTSI